MDRQEFLSGAMAFLQGRRSEKFFAEIAPRHCTDRESLGEMLALRERGGGRFAQKVCSVWDNDLMHAVDDLEREDRDLCLRVATTAAGVKQARRGHVPTTRPWRTHGPNCKCVRCSPASRGNALPEKLSDEPTVTYTIKMPQSLRESCKAAGAARVREILEAHL